MAKGDVHIGVDLGGVAQTIAALGREETEKRRRVARALEASAIEIRDDTKENANEITGNFRNSISQRKVKGENDSPGREVYSGIEYAARQEFGFRGKDSLGRTYNQKGKHPFKRAFDANRRKTIERLRRALR